MMNMMSGSKLEKLTVRGFKSFAKQTSLLFSPGITAIVGPNGSGKSNVLDALSFVMGSLSFSSLRAKTAENLLHFGKTKKSSDAEIDLLIKIDHELAENGEIRLNRKLSKDGTSVYRINGVKSTRLATLDSLAAIHIFPDSHNIVRQGDITRFVNMSAKQRRELIEVVAGIELYERKKTKAMTDLEGVETKIEKVDAVHGERVRIYNQLKKDREKVNKFNELKRLEESANFSILLNEIEGLTKKAGGFEVEKKNKEARIKELNDEIYRKTDEIGTVSSTLEKRGMKERVEVLTQLERIKMEIIKIDEEKLRELKGVETSKNRVDSIVSQINSLNKRKKETQDEISDKKKRTSDISREMAEYKQLKDELTGKITKAKQDFEKRKKDYEELKSKKDSLVLRSKELDLEKQANQRMISELKKRFEVEKGRKLKFEAERKQVLNEKKVLEKEQIKLQKTIEELSSELKSIKNREKEIIYSSNLPSGVRELRKQGFKILGEVVDDPSKIMPFAFSIVADANEIKQIKVDKGWVYAIPKSFSIKKLEEFSKLGQSIGKITEYEFKGESERSSELEEIKNKCLKLENKLEVLKNQRSVISVKLTQNFDSTRIKQVGDSIRDINEELTTRKTKMEKINTSVEKVDEKILKIGDVREPTVGEAGRLEEVSSKIFALESELMRTNSEIKAMGDTLKNLIDPDILNYKKLQKEISEEVAQSKQLVVELEEKKKTIEKQVGKFKARIETIEGLLKSDLTKKSELEDVLKKAQNEIYDLRSQNAVLDEKIKGIESRAEYLEKTKPGNVKKLENPREVLERVVKELQGLGTLNFKATEAFDEINQLVEDISERLDKLRKEKDAILKMVDEIEAQKTSVFMDTFEKINTSFSRVFSEVIEGESHLEIDGDEVFESGVTIKTRVLDRDLPTESLSGGQKTLAAIAMIFAIQEVKPSPIYVFDEIDAALDKTNSEKLSKMFKKMSETTQIIAITHNDTMVRESDQIVGVYMSRGSSKLVSLPKEKVMKEADSWIGSKN